MNHFTLLVVVLLYGTLTAQAQVSSIGYPYYASFTQPYKTIVKTSKGYVEIEYFPPMGRDASWQMLISPATTKWSKIKLDRNCCASVAPENCKTWGLSEVPAQYKTVSRQILTQPLTWTETPLWSPEIERVLEPFDFTISPNPAETQLHLDTDRNYQAAKLYITNMQGAVVYEQTVAQNESEFWIDVTHLPAGYYAVWFIDAQQHIMKDTNNKFAKK